MIFVDDKLLYESVLNMAKYCSAHVDCAKCNLRPFCKSINPVVKLEYVFNQTKDTLERNLSS